ncbi:hypothetical protein FHS77_000641 [Paenochrobactrum gallinarii]|uniref:Uncharacterized protein n=1 Tax=Paenochrobactrum gallinarii TaxID=643673 RepID=A0A841LUE2_9HYPH|nr:hypothetical protein [Paenochrobactrum gallinarii]MBB6260117.1 hypothetical protein [Paenochrobactrum gallinarii]
MNKQQIILCLSFSVFFSTAALAAPPPKKSADFNGNYTTLTQDQKAPPQIATCIATGYDLVKKDKKFDRLGFTQDGISKAKVKKAESSAEELTVHGQARHRKSGQWQDISLHCSLKNGAIKSISIGK